MMNGSIYPAPRLVRYVQASGFSIFALLAIASIFDAAARHSIGATLFFAVMLLVSGYIVPRSIRSSIVLSNTEVVLRGTLRTRRFALAAVMDCVLESAPSFVPAEALVLRTEERKYRAADMRCFFRRKGRNRRYLESVATAINESRPGAGSRLG